MCVGVWSEKGGRNILIVKLFDLRTQHIGHLVHFSEGVSTATHTHFLAARASWRPGGTSEVRVSQRAEDTGEREGEE